jgi:hypothetical protein
MEVFIRALIFQSLFYEEFDGYCYVMYKIFFLIYLSRLRVRQF